MPRSTKAATQVAQAAMPAFSFKDLEGATASLEEMGGGVAEPEATPAAGRLGSLYQGAIGASRSGTVGLAATAAELGSKVGLVSPDTATGLREEQQAIDEQTQEATREHPYYGMAGGLIGGLAGDPTTWIGGIGGKIALKGFERLPGVATALANMNKPVRSLARVGVENLGFIPTQSLVKKGELPTADELGEGALMGTAMHYGGAALGHAGRAAGILPQRVSPVRIDKSSTWSADVKEMAPSLSEPLAPLFKSGWTIGSTRRGLGHDIAKGRHTAEAPGGHSVVNEDGQALAADVTPPGGMTPQNVAKGYKALRDALGPDVNILIEDDHFHIGLTTHGKHYFFDPRTGTVRLAKGSEHLAAYGRGRKATAPTKPDQQMNENKMEAAFEQPHPASSPEEMKAWEEEDAALKQMFAEGPEMADKAGELLADRNRRAAEAAAAHEARLAAEEEAQAEAAKGSEPGPVDRTEGSTSTMPRPEGEQLGFTGIGGMDPGVDRAAAGVASGEQMGLPGIEPGQYEVPPTHPVMPTGEGEVHGPVQSLGGHALKFGNDVDRALYEVGRRLRGTTDPVTGLTTYKAATDARTQQLVQFLSGHFNQETDQEILRHAAAVHTKIEETVTERAAKPKAQASKIGDFSNKVVNRGKLPESELPTKKSMEERFAEAEPRAVEEFKAYLDQANQLEKVKGGFQAGLSDREVAEQLGYKGQDLAEGEALVGGLRDAEGIPRPNTAATDGRGPKFNKWVEKRRVEIHREEVEKDTNPTTATVRLFGEDRVYDEFIESEEYKQVLGTEFADRLFEFAGLKPNDKMNLETLRQGVLADKSDITALNDYLLTVDGHLLTKDMSILHGPEETSVISALGKSLENAAIQRKLAGDGVTLPWRDPAVLMSAISKYMGQDYAVKGVSKSQLAQFAEQIKKWTERPLDKVSAYVSKDIYPIYRALIKDIEIKAAPFVKGGTHENANGYYSLATGQVVLKPHTGISVFSHEMFHAITIGLKETENFVNLVAHLSLEDRSAISIMGGYRYTPKGWKYDNLENAAVLMQVWAAMPEKLEQAYPHLFDLGSALYEMLPERLQNTVATLSMLEKAQLAIVNRIKDVNAEPGGWALASKHKFLTSITEQVKVDPTRVKKDQLAELDADALRGTLTKAEIDHLLRDNMPGVAGAKYENAYRFMGYPMSADQAAWDALTEVYNLHDQLPKVKAKIKSYSGDGAPPVVLYSPAIDPTNSFSISPEMGLRDKVFKMVLDSPKVAFSTSRNLAGRLWNLFGDMNQRAGALNADGSLVNPHLAPAINAADELYKQTRGMMARLVEKPIWQSDAIQRVMPNFRTSFKSWLGGEMKMKAKPEVEAALRGLFDERLATGKTLTDAELVERGITDTDIRYFYSAMSHGYEAASGLMKIGTMENHFRTTTQFRELVGKGYTPELFLEGLESGEITAKDAKGERELEHLSSMAEHLVEVFKPGWSSRVRTGDHLVVVKDAEGNTIEAVGAYGKREANKIAEELTKKHAGAEDGFQPSVTIEHKGPYLPPLERAGSPDTVFEISRMLEMFHGDGTGLTSDEVMGIASRYGRKQPMPHLRRRENIPGFEQDSVFTQYADAMRRVGHYVYGSQFRDEMGQITEKHGGTDWMKADLENFFRQATNQAGPLELGIERGIDWANKRLEGTGVALPHFVNASRGLRDLAWGATLGFGNLRLMAMQISHAASVTIPETLIEARVLGKESGAPVRLQAEKSMWAAGYDAMKIFSGFDRASDSYKAVMDAIDTGLLAPTHFKPETGVTNEWGKDFITQMKSRPWAPTSKDSVVGSLTRFTDFLNTQVDFNRQVWTFLTFRRLALEFGKGVEEANAYALIHTNKTLDLRPDNRPTWMLSSGELGNSMFQFRGFLWNQLRLMTDAVRNAGGVFTEEGVLDKVAAVKPLLTAGAALSFFGGARAIFPIGLGIDLYDYFADDDVMAKARKKVRDFTGSDFAANWVDEGLGGPTLGMNFEETGSLMLPNGKKDFTGAILPVSWSILAQRVKGLGTAAVSDDPASELLKASLPNVYAHMVDAFKLQADDWKLYDKNGALLTKLTYGDRVKAVISGYGFAKREAYRRASEDKRVSKAIHDERRGMAEDIARAMLEDNPDAITLSHWHFMRTTPTAGKLIKNAYKKMTVPREQSMIEKALRTRDNEVRRARLMAYGQYLEMAELNDLEEASGMDLGGEEGVGEDEED
jgi:hypothetical protein